ncbi:MAG: membrane protein insertion efficiency factor YidD [bacterium]|nr:membrane protein insertion efficiency factor YidD [bacterium]
MLLWLYKKTKTLFTGVLLSVGISPLNCRHYPSCSIYAQQSIKANGPIIGGAKAVIRLFKCQPLFKSNYL